MEKLWNIIISFFSLEVAVYYIIALLFLTLLWILKLVLLRKNSWLVVIVCVIYTTCAYFLTPNELIYQVAVLLTIVLILVWTIADFIHSFLCEKAKQSCVNEFMKNAQYDYYFYTDKKDCLIDASMSFLKLGKITEKKSKKYRGIKVLMNELNIIKINGKDFCEDVAVAFYFEYGLVLTSLKNHKFELLVLENETYSLYEGIITPIYYKSKVLGRSVFLSKNRHVVLAELKDGLAQLKNSYEDAKLQTDILMSLSENVVMYYDFLTQTYVATDAFCKYISDNQKEYRLDEYYQMISSKDRVRYSEISETINSTSVTRITYTIIINQHELDVYEDVIFMRKDYGRVSIVKPALKALKQTEKIMKDTEVLDQLERINPRAVLDELSEILKVNIEDDE